jgi:hypothetical protein
MVRERVIVDDVELELVEPPRRARGMDQFRKRLAQPWAGGLVVSADESSARVVLTCGR